ncbi:GlxA family transcriptional regulator [Acidisoma cellulosilytica]|uniref:GlxA family transcriptional regulator n=1 Tax=Acidisoma cellulosilyticum TaxID=2802395 RepID=A0A963Z6R4_9PROT|nr:GlxA family transcriptional regulator [Acidisoma cellulosilyticum]MCB8883115.1 GlxA family transcriptional regulator [Acidisoma cellulosilyticum]
MTETKRIGFLLVPGFALLPYASAVEPLRAANEISGRALYSWHHLTPHGVPVQASNGITLSPDMDWADAASLDLLVVCAGVSAVGFHDAATLRRLAVLARQAVRMGGVSAGPYLLARAGLLKGYRFTLHWELAPSFLEEFPDLDLQRCLFEIDRDRLTCSGGAAPLDMMHALLAREHGNALAVAVSGWFLATAVRDGEHPQRMAPVMRFGVRNATVLRVIAHMEKHLDHPARGHELAAVAGISQRQLERLFQLYLCMTPTAFQLKLRLEQARTLLRQTGLSIMEVAVATGFANASHFAHAYRDRFGCTPRSDALRNAPLAGRHNPMMEASDHHVIPA